MFHLSETFPLLVPFLFCSLLQPYYLVSCFNSSFQVSYLLSSSIFFCIFPSNFSVLFVLSNSDFFQINLFPSLFLAQILNILSQFFQFFSPFPPTISLGFQCDTYGVRAVLTIDASSSFASKGFWWCWRGERIWVVIPDFLIRLWSLWRREITEKICLFADLILFRVVLISIIVAHLSVVSFSCLFISFISTIRTNKYVMFLLLTHHLYFLFFDKISAMKNFNFIGLTFFDIL